MPGFIGAIGKILPAFNTELRTKLVQETLFGAGYRVERRTVNKFMDDKIFVDSANLLLVIEGVVLNKKQLIDQYGPGESFESCIRTMYVTSGETFFKEFRGSFSGVLFDKTNDKWLIFTDHIGDKQVFYSELNCSLLFGSEMRFMVETLKQNKQPVSINKIGVYLALTHGFVIEDHTLVSEIKKLTAGHYLRYDKQGLKEIPYHRFSNKPKIGMTIEEAVEGIDKYFRNAITLQYEKDKEYGYRHLATLSGGLDSRMTVWVAHQMGYTDQLNINYSQSQYLDFTIAQNIAIDLHHDFLFKPLDHGDFISKIDEVTPITYGNACFVGLAHGKSLEDLINYEPFGLIHTGQLGDVIIGTYMSKMFYNKQIDIRQGAYSLEIIERLEHYNFVYNYENEEIFKMYNRGFCGIAQGLLTCQENTETISPFCDVEFLEFCFSIPLQLRFNHKIYIDWILQKYPEAAKYIWEKDKAVIKPIKNIEPKFMNLFGHTVPAINDKDFLKWLRGSVLRRLGFLKKGQKLNTIAISGKDNMNPFDYWYSENQSLRKFLEEYWQINNKYIEDPMLFADMNHLFNDCVVYDKLQCLSVLSAIKLLKNETK